ncbi:uncharacterized protein LOC134237659 [Saccostrea cucullata]|uniref:uncharacterized protein LOC134237659 n=1 Tax=Saccostrea cuccullata TaxID=36930 RepID=UPI002ED28146
MTSTMKWSTVAWTVSDTSTRTQVQSEGGVLVPIVIAVVSVTSVVIGLLIIYCFCLKKRKRNREEECHASGQHFISQERSYTVSEENVQSVVEESFKPSECLYFGETKCLQTCSLQTVTSNKDNELSQEKHEYDTQEGSEGHYNTLLLRTGLCNQTNNRCIEEAGTYSHIKALEGPTDVLLMEQYDHVNVVFNT